MSQNVVNCLYEHFKNTPKKLKIVCDWDEVIQAHEPYTTWLAIYKEKELPFPDYFKTFWKTEPPLVEYSPYGSKIKEDKYNPKVIEKQQARKNSPDLYQNQPFLTLAKELLMLIKENKVEKLIFLSAYDKRKFPQGDSRKLVIVKETFGKHIPCSLELIGFDSESKGANKADWIKANATDFDMMIDDNPIICQNIVESVPNLTVIAPFYPAVAKQYHKKVLLVKNSVSNLKKRIFKENCIDLVKLFI